MQGKMQGKIWTGRALSALAALFLAFDAIMKFIRPAPVIEAFAHLGWPIALAPSLGAILLISTTLYVIPKTSYLGAVILTGYLGGAVSAHYRVGDNLFSRVLFPVYMGIMLWAGLYLRDSPTRRPLHQNLLVNVARNVS